MYKMHILEDDEDNSGRSVLKQDPMRVSCLKELRAHQQQSFASLRMINTRYSQANLARRSRRRRCDECNIDSPVFSLFLV